jgi:hypothetical protein
VRAAIPERLGGYLHLWFWNEKGACCDEPSRAIRATLQLGSYAGGMDFRMPDDEYLLSQVIHTINKAVDLGKTFRSREIASLINGDRR